MSKMCKLIVAAIASVVTMTTVANAESRDFRERGNKKKSTTISRSGQIGSFNLFGINWGSGNYNRNGENGDLIQRQVRKPPKKIMVYTYKPDLLVELADRRAEQPRPERPVFSADAPADYDPTPSQLRSVKLDDSLAQTVFDLLKAGDTGLKVTKNQRKEIAAFYKDRGYKAVWTSMDGLEPQAHRLIDVLKTADAEGLNAADYAIPELRLYANDIHRIESELRAIARIEIQLTALAVRYAQHASGGRISANRLSAYHDLKQPRIGAHTVLRSLAAAEDPADYLMSLHPKHFAYSSFKQALADVRNTQQSVEVVEPIPSGPLIRPGALR